VKTAFVLSGGASLGAVQVGMLQALIEQGITPDVLVGTSAGALNTAYISGHGATPSSVQSLAQVWAHLNVRTLFAVDPVHVLRALAGKSSSVCSDRGLRTQLRRHLTFETLEDAPIPLVVVTTELATGGEVSLRTGGGKAKHWLTAGSPTTPRSLRPYWPVPRPSTFFPRASHALSLSRHEQPWVL